MASLEKKKPCEEARDLWRAYDEFWERKSKSISELERFLSGDRYEMDYGPFQRDRRLQQIIGQEIQDTHRHNVAKATERPRSVTPRGLDDIEDDSAGEIVAALVEARLSDPYLGFDDEYEDAVHDAHALRLGVVWMDYDPNLKPDAQITFARQDPRSMRWDPCYKNPHHPLCGWVHRTKRIDVDYARKIYKVDWLEPDRSMTGRHHQWNPGVPLLLRANGDRAIDPSAIRDNKVTIWEWWFKDAYALESPQKPQMLPETHRYMACQSGCGHRITKGEWGDQPMPEQLAPRDQMTGAGGCPTCGGPMERVDFPTDEEQKLNADSGKRLLIMAPFAPAPDDESLYDGGWPIPRARSYPGLFLTQYSKGGDPVPQCDTDLMWPQQVALDNLRSIALQRVYEHQDMLVLPSDGINDYKGDRWERRDDQFNLLFRDASAMGNLQIERINGTGLDPAFGEVFSVINSALTQYRGTTDLGLTEESSKNIAASTVAQMETQKAIPGAHFGRRKNRALGMFYGVESDYELATLTPERAKQFHLDEVAMSAALSGQDFKRHDFIIEDTPEFTGMEKARSESFQALMQIYTTAITSGLEPMALIEIYAEVNRLPKSIVKKFGEMLANRPMPMVGPDGQPIPGGPTPGPGGPGAGAMPEGGPPDFAQLAGLGQ